MPHAHVRGDANGSTEGTVPSFRAMKFQGVPLDALLTSFSSPSFPASGRFSSYGSLITMVVWATMFFGVLGGGLAWFGVYHTLPFSAETAYQRKLPVAAHRILPTSENLTDDGYTNVASAPLLPQANAAVLSAHTGSELIIPALHLTLPLVRAKTVAEEDIEDALTHGVVLYPNGVEPGTKGNAVITAHSTAEPWKGIFRFAFLHINKLQRGDTIQIDEGPRRFTYEVIQQRIVDPNDVPTVSAEAPEARLILTTCWPLWSTDKRLLVEARLIDTSARVYEGS